MQGPSHLTIDQEDKDLIPIGANVNTVRFGGETDEQCFGSNVIYLHSLKVRLYCGHRVRTGFLNLNIAVTLIYNFYGD